MTDTTDRLISVQKSGDKYVVEVRFLAEDPFAGFVVKPDEVDALVNALAGKLVYDVRQEGGGK